jgi:hypothetical protein
MKHALVLLALASCFVALGHAASTQAPPETMLACTRMSDPGERLRCYDTQMAAMGATVATPSPAAAPQGPVATAPKTELAVAPPVAVPPAAASVPPPSPVPPPLAEQKFGAVDLPRTAREKVDQPEKLLLSSIASIRQVRPKLWLIVLANGQIWLQDGTQITMFFRAGYDVRIERGLLEGDYRMSTAQTGAKNWVKVTRVQ